MKLFVVLMAIFLNSAFAEKAFATDTTSLRWSIVAGSGSYMGENHLGVQYLTQSGRHAVDFSYGRTLGDLNNDVEQLNLKYNYSPFNFSLNNRLSTNILGIGILATRWQSESAFMDSPSQYPATNYYSPTRWRFGFSIEQTWTYRSISLYANWILLDQAIIALYNNEKFIEGRSPWGAGLGIRWEI